MKRLPLELSAISHWKISASMIGLWHIKRNNDFVKINFVTNNIAQFSRSTNDVETRDTVMTAADAILFWKFIAFQNWSELADIAKRFQFWCESVGQHFLCVSKVGWRQCKHASRTQSIKPKALQSNVTALLKIGSIVDNVQRLNCA